MELKNHNRTILELSRWVKYLLWSNVSLLFITLLISIYLIFQNKIVVVQIPGGGTEVETTYEKNTIDKGSQKAIILAAVSAISQINTANYAYQKLFIQSFLSPEVFTAITSQIDAHVKKMIDQRELGSFYFEFKEYAFDPILNKHFVRGDVHTVNAVKNTSEPWIYELTLRVENYRPMITSLDTYSGLEFHNSIWIDKEGRGNL